MKSSIWLGLQNSLVGKGSPKKRDQHEPRLEDAMHMALLSEVKPHKAHYGCMWEAEAKARAGKTEWWSDSNQP